MKSRKLFSYKKSKQMEDLALRMALYCVRNTIIEKYHSDGKISDPEMMVFNKEVVNKIYTILELISNPGLEQECDIAFLKLPHTLYKPHNWVLPQFDEGLKKAIGNIATLRDFEKEKTDKNIKDFKWINK